MVLLKFADGSTYNIPLKDLENIPFFNIFPEITNETEINLGQYNKNFTYKNLMKCIGFSEKLDNSCIDLMDYLGQDFKYYSQETVNKAFNIFSLRQLNDSKDYIPIILRCQIDNKYWILNFENMIKLPFNIFKKCITESNVNSKNRHNNTGLMLACEMCGKKIVEFLINKGANITDKDRLNNTLLIIASKYNNKEIVEYLINIGVNVNDENYDGYTALLYAYDNDNIEIMKLLINAGASVDDILFESICKDGFTELVKMIIDKGKSVNSNKRLLPSVSMKGDLDVIKLLVEAGIDINSYNGRAINQTALYYACFCGHKEIVEYLLEHNAEIHNALTIASYKGHKNIVEILIKNGANVNFKDYDGYTALMYANEKDFKEIIKLLKDAGA